MALHKDLTGADLHEPKGVATAPAGSVYIADGAGSGAWTNKNSDILNANYFTLQDTMKDVGTAGGPDGAVYFYIPQKCEIVTLASIIYGPIATTNTILSIYINGVLFADSLTIPFTGSTAGQKDVKTITTSNTVNAGSVIEVRSDGATSSTVAAAVNLLLRNKA
jgi:hypothetical protein